MTHPVPDHLTPPDVSALTELQAHTQRLCRHFKWDAATDHEIFLLLTEEFGELAKAIRKREKLFIAAHKVESDEAIQANLAEEMADILSYLFDLANRYGVDLGKAYTDKMLANLQRSWE